MGLHLWEGGYTGIHLWEKGDTPLGEGIHLKEGGYTSRQGIHLKKSGMHLWEVGYTSRRGIHRGYTSRTRRYKVDYVLSRPVADER